MLIRRKNPPFQNAWAFPGGFLNQDETVRACASRELLEETSLDITDLSLIGVFSKPDRDPRSRVITIAYQAAISPARMQEAEAGDDAKALAWHLVQDIRPTDLAFDHWEILQGALSHSDPNS